MIKLSVMTGERAGTLPVEMGFFPCGERKLTIEQGKLPGNIIYDQVTLKFRYDSDQDIIDLMLMVDAIKRCDWLNYEHLVLFITYFPYGRQDRVANEGEPHSLKVIASLINSCDFNKVFVVDPHSDVIEAVLNNPAILDMAHMVFASQGEPFIDCDAYVSPDAGAYKKVMKAATVHNKPVIRADKTRDTMTGALSGFEIYAEDLTGQHVVILDDICDGGGTFIGLAKKLREKGAERITLYVTHGKFTKGVDALKEFIDEIYTFEYTGPQDDAWKVHELELYKGD